MAAAARVLAEKVAHESATAALRQRRKVSVSEESPDGESPKAASDVENTSVRAEGRPLKAKTDLTSSFHRAISSVWTAPSAPPVVSSGANTVTTLESIGKHVTFGVITFLVQLCLGEKEMFLAAVVGLCLPIVGYIGLRGSENKLAKIGQDITTVRFVSSVATYMSLAINCYCILRSIGIITADSESQLTTIGGVAVGIGCQPLFQNVAAGAALAFFRPFRVGDTIIHKGEWVTVRAITSFFTHVDSFLNHHFAIPNSTILAGDSVNVTANATQCIYLSVFVRCGHVACSQVQQVLEQAGDEFDMQLPDLLVQLGLDGLPALQKAQVHGPLALTRKGMEWQMWITVPSSIYVPAVTLGNRIIHDTLLEAEIPFYEEVLQQASS